MCLILSDLNKYLEHIIVSTNMRCLTPPSALVGDCGFLSANLYARSVFGEDALANVSIEQSPENNKISGVIRIRYVICIGVTDFILINVLGARRKVSPFPSARRLKLLLRALKEELIQNIEQELYNDS